MSNRFITYLIIGVAFGFTQLWFAFWVVKLFKEKQRILLARKAAVRAGTSGRAVPPAKASERAVPSAGTSGRAVPPAGDPGDAPKAGASSSAAGPR